MPVRTVASQSKINFFAELCFVCAVWCFLLLFMRFFHSIAYFGSVFFRFKLSKNGAFVYFVDGTCKCVFSFFFNSSPGSR